MKKYLFFILFLLITLNSTAFAYDIDLTKEGQYQKKIMEMGVNILNANRIESRAIFWFTSNKYPNAYANTAKVVVIYSGLLPFIEDDSELAGIMSHEIAHTVDFNQGFWRTMAMGWSPKKYEEKADKKAVDYMVKAGYDPVAFIVVMNKIGGQYNKDWGMSHPLTSKRLAYIYGYIYQKYPAYLADNAYRTNIYYQNFLLTSKKDREKIIRENQSLINVSNKKK